MPERPKNRTSEPRENLPSAEPSRLALKPLMRMRQLATEIETGVNSNDMELVCKAAALLAPALAQIKAAQPEFDVTAGEAAQIALDTYNCLRKSERSLEVAMERIAAEIARLRRGVRKLSITRGRYARPSVARRLDTRK